MKVKVKNGEVELRSIVIPDLWHIALLPELKGYHMSYMGKDTPAKDLILETWHLAHHLRRALEEVEAKQQAGVQHAEI